MACEGGIRKILLGNSGEILYKGVSERFFTPAQRRALAVRDGGCIWDGCTAPPGWCHAHHVFEAERGGPTDIDNGVLFCPAHHHMLHSSKVDGSPTRFPYPVVIRHRVAEIRRQGKQTMDQHRMLLHDPVTSAIVGIVMFVVLLVFTATSEDLIFIPLGIEAVHFLSARWRHSRKTHSDRRPDNSRERLPRREGRSSPSQISGELMLTFRDHRNRMGS